MKRYNKFIITLAALVGTLFAPSCDYLEKEPDPELEWSMIWNKRDYVYGQFAFAWSRVRDPMWNWLADTGWETFGDDITPSQRWQQWGWNCIPKIMGNWSVNSPWSGNMWHEMPQAIRAAYIFQRDAHALPDQDLPQEEIDRMKAECRFLAAYYWWELARTYGGIAYRPNYIAPTDASVDVLYAPSVPFDQIVADLDKELLEVADLLPSTYQEPEKYGRATKIMALTVRARMLLFAASPLVNGNEWYKGYTNKAGDEIFNTKYDHSKWVKAAEACKLLVETADENGFRLFTLYNEDGTIDPFRSVEEMFSTTWSQGNREILFPYPYTKANYVEYTKHASAKGDTDIGGNGGLGVYQGLVDAFFMKNGLPIDDDESGYVENGFSADVEKRNTGWIYGTGRKGEVTDAGTYNMYCNREPRFYTTVSYNGSWSHCAGRKLDFLRGHSDNNYTHDAPQNGYLVRKKVIQTDNPRTGIYKSPRPVWLYRLGGAYLDYAEAVNMAYDSSTARQTALEYLNRIRQRAGVRMYTTGSVSKDDENFIHVDDTQAAIDKVIRMERRVELCCEGLRWTDIRRWKIAEELPEVSGDCYGMNYAGANEADFYQRTVYQTRVWKRAYYWMPIFYAEMEKNPNLVQGPFWN